VRDHAVVREEVTIRVGDPTRPEVAQLLVELDAYLNDLYPPEDNFLDLPPDDVDGEQGVLLVARADGAVVGCGAVRRRGDDCMEIKRMYVRPEVRGLGLGRRLLDELARWAAARGASRLVLETGDQQPEALALYANFGFERVPCFDEYASAPNSLCYEKRLSSPPASH
jgi:putative acetyltransferase